MTTDADEQRLRDLVARLIPDTAIRDDFEHWEHDELVTAIVGAAMVRNSDGVMATHIVAENESLRAELEALRQRNDQLDEVAGGTLDRGLSWMDRCESAEAERDQALQALQRIAQLHQPMLNADGDAVQCTCGDYPDKTHTGGLAMTSLEQWREQEACRLQEHAEPDETRCESVIWSAQAPKGFIGDNEHKWSRCGRHVGHDGRHEVAGIFNQTWE